MRECYICIQDLIKTPVRNKFGSKKMKVMLRIALKGHMRTLMILLKRQFLCEKIELNMSSYMLTLHVIYLESDAYCSRISVLFPNYEVVD